MTKRNVLLLGLFMAAAFPAAAEVTFSRDVAPIVLIAAPGAIAGEAAPFSLLSYDDVAKRGKLIATVTAARISRRGRRTRVLSL